MGGNNENKWKESSGIKNKWKKSSGIKNKWKESFIIGGYYGSL